jgi:hypothetical protein
MPRQKLQLATSRLIAEIFRRLDYARLGPVYCDEGGDEFWKAKRGPCLRIGTRLAEILRPKLAAEGRSLYVGAGVPEIPVLVMEMMELRRKVSVHNLRVAEVRALNRTCSKAGVRFKSSDALSVQGQVDHLWIVSVLNDPERLPDLAALSYGRAEPLTFDPAGFVRQRRTVRISVKRCLAKLSLPGWVTTTTEELQWVAEWCHMRNIPYRVEDTGYATATVGDPVCMVRLG